MLRLKSDDESSPICFFVKVKPEQKVSVLHSTWDNSILHPHSTHATPPRTNTGNTALQTRPDSTRPCHTLALFLRLIYATIGCIGNITSLCRNMKGTKSSWLRRINRNTQILCLLTWPKTTHIRIIVVAVAAAKPKQRHTCMADWATDRLQCCISGIMYSWLVWVWIWDMTAWYSLNFFLWLVDRIAGRLPGWLAVWLSKQTN